MFEKKKMNFWRLSFIFIGFIVITLTILWSSPQEPDAQMMSGSMGNMMKEMHTDNITIYDLLGTESQKEQMGDMQSHHQEQSATIVSMSFLSTAIIFLLLPLIIGGAIILAIVWIR